LLSNVVSANSNSEKHDLGFFKIRKKYTYGFTEQELRQGSARCIYNVKGLLDSALILLDHKDSQQYALGLICMQLKNLGRPSY
jgi:hypothetical protein